MLHKVVGQGLKMGQFLAGGWRGWGALPRARAPRNARRGPERRSVEGGTQRAPARSSATEGGVLGVQGFAESMTSSPRQGTMLQAQGAGQVPLLKKRVL